MIGWALDCLSDVSRITLISIACCIRYQNEVDSISEEWRQEVEDLVASLRFFTNSNHIILGEVER